MQLTSLEKSSLRLKLSQHMHRHPIGSRPSMFNFRYAMTAALVMVLFFGTGGLVTFAAQSSLPGQNLYGVKRASEQVKKLTIRDSLSKANYELALIDKRFSETNQLIAEQKLTTETEAIVIAAIARHTNDFKTETNDLAQSNPSEALSYNTKLGNTLKTGTHILLALSDQKPNTAQSISPNTLVLAAYSTAEKISIEKQELEAMIVSDTNVATIKTAEKKYAATLAVLTENNITPADPINPETTPVEAVTVMKAVVEAPVAKMAVTAEVDATATTIATTLTEEPKPTLQTLADQMKAAYDAKQYGNVIIIADQIDQLLHETQKIQEAEKAYNVTISSDTDSIIKIQQTDVKSDTIVAPTLELMEEIPLESTSTEVTTKK